MVVTPIHGVVESEIVVEGGVGREAEAAAIFCVDAVMTVADDVVADIEYGMIDRAVIADAGQNAHVRLVDGVVVDVDVIGRVPHLNSDGAFVVDQVVIDSGLGIAAIAAADGVDGVAVVEEVAARRNVAKHVVVHAAGAAGIAAAAPGSGREGGAKVVAGIAAAEIVKGVVGHFEVAFAPFQQQAERIQTTVDLYAGELKAQDAKIASGAAIVPHILAVATAVDGGRSMHIGLPGDAAGIGDDAGGTAEIVGAGQDMNDITRTGLPVDVVERATRMRRAGAVPGIGPIWPHEAMVSGATILSNAPGAHQKQHDNCGTHGIHNN